MSDNDKPQFEPARSTLALNTPNSPSADPMLADEVRMRRALGLYGDQPRPRTPERNDPPQQQRPADRYPGSNHTNHKRRFVHDGEVPVTLVHGLTPNRREHADGNGARNGHTPPTNRLEVAEAALAAEIARRERTERALQEAQAAVHDLQTKLGHADLARQEAVDQLQRERDASSELRVALHQAEERIVAAEHAQAAAEQALSTLRDRMAEPEAEPVEPVEPPAPRPRRGRKPRVQAAPEPPPPVAKPRKSTAASRKKAAPVREPKPIRWWAAPRSKNAPATKKVARAKSAARTKKKR